MKISVVVIAHNEESNIAKLIDGLMQRYGDKILEIVVVDDASTDQTAEVTKDVSSRYPDIKLVSKGPPCGVGYALKRGLKEVNSAAEYILTMDADFINSVPQVEYLIKEAENGQEAVIGSRFLKESRLIGYKKSKWLVNRFYHFMARIILGIPYHDVTNNFKLYKSSIFKTIPLRSNGFSINAETGILPHLYGFHIKEVAVNWIERMPGMGKSKFRIWGVWFDYAVSLFWCYWLKVKICLNRQKK